MASTSEYPQHRLILRMHQYQRYICLGTSYARVLLFTSSNDIEAAQQFFETEVNAQHFTVIYMTGNLDIFYTAMSSSHPLRHSNMTK